MAYIGRGTDSISNVEVLDNITFSGASSYTLQKGSANYVPISAANILVSIDGVVQANNFSVNGSTIDFGVAIANTSTCNFILHYGVGLVTTVQDGAITSTKLGSSSVTSAKIASNSIATASIIDDAVNYAKMQDVSQNNRLLGAETAGTIAELQVNTNMIADAQVDESKLKISNAPTNGYFLSAQSGGSGGMTWAEAGGTLVLIKTITGDSNTTSITFDNGSSGVVFDTTYDQYILRGSRVRGVTNNTYLRIQFKNSGGTISSGYRTVGSYYRTDGSVTNGSSGQSTYAYEDAGNIRNTNAEYLALESFIVGVGHNMRSTMVTQSTYKDNQGRQYLDNQVGAMDSTSTVTGLYIQMSSGNLQGNFSLYGVKK